MYASVAGPAGGIVLADITKTAVLHGAETKNAQLAINSKGGNIPVGRIQSPFKPSGPGVGVNVLRNILAMSGVRVINEPIKNSFVSATGLDSEVVVTGADLVANCVAACVTMPLHMLYQHIVTTPEMWDRPQAERMADMNKFLSNECFPGGKLSSVVPRDVTLRASYIATAYTMFGGIEQTTVK